MSSKEIVLNYLSDKLFGKSVTDETGPQGILFLSVVYAFECFPQFENWQILLCIFLFTLPALHSSWGGFNATQHFELLDGSDDARGPWKELYSKSIPTR